MANLLSFNETCWYKELQNACNHECEHCTRYFVIKSQMQQSGVPENLHHPIPLIAPDCDLEAYRKLALIKDDIDEFVYEGKNLYICGSETGNGKTSWALKLMYKYFSYMWTYGLEQQALFINVPELLLKLKDFNNPISQEYKELITSVPLVIWDDIAISGVSNWDSLQLYVLLNQRCQKQLSNIYTSNCTDFTKLSSYVGTKIASRILTKDTDIIELKGEDYR